MRQEAVVRSMIQLAANYHHGAPQHRHLLVDVPSRQCAVHFSLQDTMIVTFQPLPNCDITRQKVFWFC